MSSIQSSIFLKKGVFPLVLLSFLFFLTTTVAFQKHPAELSFGILLDLLITLPILYLLLIWHTGIPKFTVLYALGAGMLLASWMIPVSHQTLLTQIKYWAIPAIEFSVLSLVIYKMWSLNTRLRATHTGDFYDRLRMACTEIFPGKVGKILTVEISVIYYLFTFKGKPTLQENACFSYHRKSGVFAGLAVLLFLFLIETFVVHLLVNRWDATVAWVLTGLGLYTLMQIVAIMRSMVRRPIHIDETNQVLRLNYGFASQTVIPFDQVEAIELTKRLPNQKDDAIQLSFFRMLDSINVVLHLKESQSITRLYGGESDFRSIAFFVDRREVFVNQIELILTQYAEQK